MFILNNTCTVEAGGRRRKTLFGLSSKEFRTSCFIVESTLNKVWFRCCFVSLFLCVQRPEACSQRPAKCSWRVLRWGLRAVVVVCGLSPTMADRHFLPILQMICYSPPLDALSICHTIVPLRGQNVLGPTFGCAFAGHFFFERLGRGPMLRANTYRGYSQ